MMNMEGMKKLWNVVYGLRPILMMMLVQIFLSVMVILYKLASEDGMSMQVLTAYRYMFTLVTILPLAFFFERKRRPKLTWIICLQAFFVALFGSTMAQNMFAESIILTSGTFSTAMSNLVPAITFIMALCFRIETLGLRSMIGKAKVVGTLISISGAMVLTMYKGVEIKILSTSIDLLHKDEQQDNVTATHHHHHDVNHRPYLGSLLALGSCFCAAFSLILQTKLSVRYPCHYSSSALIYIFGVLQTVVFVLCSERDWTQWKLGWNVRLLTTVYAGTVATGIAAPISMWCVRMRGPLFVSIFNPLLLVNVAIASSLFIKEKLHLGSVLGAAISVCGLYIVIWGKSKEMKRLNQLIPSKSIEACNITSPAKVDETKTIIPINPLLGVDSNIPPIIIPSADENNETLCEIETVGRRNEDP